MDGWLDKEFGREEVVVGIGRVWSGCGKRRIHDARWRRGRVEGVVWLGEGEGMAGLQIVCYFIDQTHNITSLPPLNSHIPTQNSLLLLFIITQHFKWTRNGRILPSQL